MGKGLGKTMVPRRKNFDPSEYDYTQAPGSKYTPKTDYTKPNYGNYK